MCTFDIYLTEMCFVGVKSDTILFSKTTIRISVCFIYFITKVRNNRFFVYWMFKRTNKEYKYTFKFKFMV
jgi:hypothetical protein